jgi:hypothetical protein
LRCFRIVQDLAHDARSPGPSPDERFRCRLHRPLFNGTELGYVQRHSSAFHVGMSTLSTLLRHWRDPWGRLRIVSISSWLVLSLLSITVGFWMTGPSNALGAQVLVSRGSEGGVYVSVRNFGAQPWQDVLIDFDNRYFVRMESVAMGVELNISMADAVNRWAMPRTPGLFGWEGSAWADQFPGFEGDRVWYPRRVTVSAEQGTVEFPIEPAAE